MMTRTPDEIKKAMLYCIEPFCPSEECPYSTLEMCAEAKTQDALAYIRQLEDHLRDATKKVEQLEAERDAAVKDLANSTASHCPYCKNYDKPGRAIVCINCRNGAPRCKQHFEWRGVQKVE